MSYSFNNNIYKYTYIYLNFNRKKTYKLLNKYKKGIIRKKKMHARVDIVSLIIS